MAAGEDKTYLRGGFRLEDWEDNLYQEVFNSMVDFASERLRDGIVDLEDLRGMLQAEYHKQGLGWIGKSRIMEIHEAATIAAFESVLNRESGSSQSGG